MKKKATKWTGLLLSLLLILSLGVPAFAADASQPIMKAQEPNFEAAEKSYPFVFVHGMMGWGENAEASFGMPYWGFQEGNNVPEYLRSMGYTVAVPTVGPMSSAWDRACELYAQLTGTRVDYGAAHAQKYRHARYGRDYTDRPVLEGGWDLKTPINLVSHSFGGPAVSAFASIMEYGVKEEIDAAADCSEFFKGGKVGLVHSVNTLASPHNGTPLSNLLYDIKLPILIAAFIMNIANTKLGTDYMFDQFGLTKDPSTGESAKLNLSGIRSIFKSDDHCAYDMTIKGARELNAKYPPATGTYYFSYTGDITEDGLLGRKVSKQFSGGIFGFTGSIICLCAGKYIGGEKLGREWANSDGFIPVVSGRYPFGQEHTDYTEGTVPEKGIWNVMPVVEGASHGYHVGGQQQTLYGFYDAMTALIAETV